MKLCYQCNQNPAPKQGMCKECKSEYNKAWYQNNKDKHKSDAKVNNAVYRERNIAIITEAKSVPCKDCGGIFHPVQMDFDHINDDKEYNVAKLTNYALETLLKEIDKCEVVCSNCHRMRTLNRRLSIA